MNPCPARKKDLILLAAQALEPSAAESLSHHLEECASCRQYWEEMSQLCRGHALVLEEIPLPPTSLGFHQILISRLQDQERTAEQGCSPALLNFWSDWRRAAAWAGAAGLAVLGLVLFFAISKPRHSHSITQVMGPASSTVIKGNPPESLISYRLAVNESMDSLDALLARNSAAPLQPAKMLITASMRSRRALTE